VIFDRNQSVIELSVSKWFYHSHSHS